MSNTFNQFMDMIDKNDKHCVWIKSHSLQSYSEEIVKEIEELRDGLKNNDLKNIEEEIGDVLYGVFILAKIAERKHGFKIETVMKNTLEKIHRRKPYIFEEREVTMDEAIRLWKEAKQKEKHQ